MPSRARSPVLLRSVRDFLSRLEGDGEAFWGDAALVELVGESCTFRIFSDMTPGRGLGVGVEP
jgi:hypothetical protein